MTALLDDFEAFKRRVEESRAEAQRAEGAYKQVMKQIKRELGVSTLKEARRLIAARRKKELLLTKKYLAARKKFEAKYGKDLKT